MAEAGTNQRRTARVLIAGRVQGVGYRAWTAEWADQLSLTGFVRNRHSGAVEAEFRGDTDRVTQMLELLADGPPGAEITSIAIVSDALADAGADTAGAFCVLPTL